MTRWMKYAAIAGLSLVVVLEAHALIEGGTGNTPLRDPGWPKGAAAIFNHPGRVAYWVGPPFGGGQWHSECRGDVKALNAVLADFAKIDAKVKRVVVHDGVGHSFWLAPNREPAKLAAAKIDWMFIVWEPSTWERLRKLPTDLNPAAPTDSSPPVQLDVFTANIKWADMIVPNGIEIRDQRMEAHGYTPADGLVLEGIVRDLSNKQPISATIKIEKVEPQKKGGYNYPVVTETKTDQNGRWVIKKAPTGWVRIVGSADGFAPRVVSYQRYDEQPRWQQFDAGLARGGAVSGRVVDDEGKPLADADVRLGNVTPQGGGRYQSPNDYEAKTDADGRFRIEPVPVGNVAIWVHKSGYVRPGLGQSVKTPSEDVELRMGKSASVRVVIDFTGKERPTGYMVRIAPEGGEKIGSYGGSGDINAEGVMSFKDMPPGKYIIRGRPNPGSDPEETEPLTVDLKGGEVREVTIKAK
jgi:hypothetical protein